MADPIFEQIEEKKKRAETFNKIKSDGYKLLKEGKIDAKTYYARTREVGIEMGMIDPNDYPGRLPPFAEGFLEIVGGIGGAIGGAVLGAPAGPPGIIAGATAGAGLGAGGASLAADFLGDLLAPDMPSPSAGERAKDVVIQI